MKGPQQFIGIFNLGLSVNKTKFNSVIVFYIKFGTKHATWKHDHCYEVASF